MYFFTPTSISAIFVFRMQCIHDDSFNCSGLEKQLAVRQKTMKVKMMKMMMNMVELQRMKATMTEKVNFNDYE